MEENLRTQLLELGGQPLEKKSIRRIDLQIMHGLARRSKLNVNFYLREGNRRITRYSYAATVDHVLAWCRHLARAIDSHRYESPTSGPVSEHEESEQVTEMIDAEDAPVDATTNSSLADELRKLAVLREKGFLTDDQFEKAKTRIIGPE